MEKQALCFDSILVRLKASDLSTAALNAIRFDSILVRLKADYHAKSQR